MKKIGLVLSGGSAYGYAHIGVLKVLEKNNIPFDVIAGTSMGAIVGGYYAAGLSVEEMEKIVLKFTQGQMFDLNLFGLMDKGLLYGNKLTRLFKKHLGDKKIEDCSKKFCCISTDLVTGNKYVFEKGSLVDAMRASMSIPGLFRPIMKDKMCLVDGGISDNMPVEDARRLGAEKVIAVDVCSYYKKENNLKYTVECLISGLNKLVSNYCETKTDKGDVYIRVEQPKVKFSTFGKDNAIQSIKYGEEAAKKMLPEILKLLEK